MTRHRKITVTFNSAGWTTPAPELAPKPCTTVLPRSLAGLPPCTEPTVWRVERYRAGSISTSYFCDQDLPAEHRGGAA